MKASPTRLFVVKALKPVRKYRLPTLVNVSDKATHFYQRSNYKFIRLKIVGVQQVIISTTSNPFATSANSAPWNYSPKAFPRFDSNLFMSFIITLKVFFSSWKSFESILIYPRRLFREFCDKKFSFTKIFSKVTFKFIKFLLDIR